MRKLAGLFLFAMTCIEMYCCGTIGLCSEPEYEDMSPSLEASEVALENTPEIAVAVEYIEDVGEPEPNISVEETEEIMYYTEDEVAMVAKVLHRECGSLPSETEQACVAWTICNRVDSDEFPGDTVAEIVTARYQFAYDHNTPVTDELYALAADVLGRWNAERNGAEEVGRVLPVEYTYFAGNGSHNYFRTVYRGKCAVWDYSLPSPYES